ncbi:DUF4411 family protein [Methylicorpusculum oleiharenae]|uniref:PIN domain-containing protein n=1 Tax=Methylicorpusculum oleiharenae TaxID=1338687 RepID=UPI001357B764|nr:PIN domain-containing protein [Methylicorpusculum oleiharenae]MCD2450991.1 DUF4411 family protein [Methylicorpusculum oleiharenae]
MIYVFDTSSLSKLKHFYPGVFKSVWNEMERGNPDQYNNVWLKERKEIFTIPSAAELRFVAEIFKITHFQALIGEQRRLKGTPVADPFVIACAKINQGTVVTEELFKPNATKIPNVCQYFQIPCIDPEKFMQQQDWSF